MNVDEVRESLQSFGWVDYMVFVLMLASCAAIGVYFALQMRRKAKLNQDLTNKDAEDDYLVGGRKMKIFPIAMSLISSFISGITLLGTPTEIYLYGTQYLYIIVAMISMGFLMHYFYLPVYHELKLISTYQYLESRFDKKVRLFGSILFICGTMLWLPIVIYVPALAFNQATGANIHLVTPMVCLVCIFYTCVGGLKAVVWTDVVQTLLMCGAMVLIMIKGTMDIGGPSVVFKKAMDSGRIEAPNFTFDIFERYTIWSLVIGGVPHWLKSNAINQNMIQRYLSLPTLASARKAIWYFITGVLIFLVICGYSGLLIYATYSECDPLETKLAKRKDQLLSLLVMETLKDYPGLPGLFVAGVFSAALSSLSTGLNSMSAVILEDFFKMFVKKPLTKRQTAFIMRFVVVVFGALCVGLVFVVEQLGTVLQLSITLSSVANGPLLGIFTAGLMIPWVGGTGALVGGFVSLAFMVWMCVSAQLDLASGAVKYIRKPFTTVGCNYTFVDLIPMSQVAENITEVLEEVSPPSLKVYHISYLFYTMVGAVITIVVALAVTFALGTHKIDSVDSTLLSPFARRWIERQREKKPPVPTTTDPKLINGNFKVIGETKT
ncbi:sodium-coupled monocarboxylate transporter 1 [Musca vetustissima]|uniref:sodium-coupled monocarboxylate transporter 1 n=1 Tax=Musca vetustissima TaxID=27455 RepID=UPI002AB735CA|nr:sodium-coupled monocarboxylate transporter 1 [Musca vetustissima]